MKLRGWNQMFYILFQYYIKVYVEQSKLSHSPSVFVLRIRSGTGSGSYISKTSPALSPLCWCYSPQPTTLMVHTHSHHSHVCSSVKSSFQHVSVLSQWWSLPTPWTEPTPFSLWASAWLVSSDYYSLCQCSRFGFSVSEGLCCASWQGPTAWWTYWQPSSITSSGAIYWWVTHTVRRHSGSY